MDFLDYKNDILKCYHSKRTDNTLSIRLKNPSPATLKKECLATYKKGIKKKDEGIIDTFFGPLNGTEDYYNKIKTFDRDKFKPLFNFLMGRTSNPEDKNIELLAWLIDYEIRPYHSQKSNPLPVKVENGTEYILPSHDPHPETVLDNNELSGSKIQPETKRRKPGVNKMLLASMTILIVLTGGFLAWKNLTSTNGCMYWAGDHYEAIDCSNKKEHSQVIDRDDYLLQHFKKITTSSSITRSSIGKVWYIKIDGNLEYFTAESFYPTDPKLRLRPLTQYMFDKYIQPEKEAKH